MSISARTQVLARGVGVIGATAALMFGITFAAVSNSVTLSANQIGVGSANLQIANVGGGYGNSATGFKALNLTPGGDFSDYFKFYLQNQGTSPLSLSVSTNLTAADLNGVDPNHIFGELYLVDGNGNPAGSAATFTLAQLMATNGNPYTAPASFNLAPNATQEYAVRWKADNTAGSGNGGQTTNNFDITITGTSPSTTTP